MVWLVATKTTRWFIVRHLEWVDRRDKETVGGGGGGGGVPLGIPCLLYTNKSVERLPCTHTRVRAREDPFFESEKKNGALPLGTCNSTNIVRRPEQSETDSCGIKSRHGETRSVRLDSDQPVETIEPTRHWNVFPSLLAGCVCSLGCLL
jgi:hypothetical protein